MILRAGSIGLLLAAAGAVAGCSDGPGGGAARAATPAMSALPAPPAPYVAVARGKVDVDGGLLELGSVEAGQVVSVAVEEGAHVAQGDVIVQLSADDARADVDLADAELRRAETVAGQQRAPLAQADLEVARQRAAVARLRLARRTVRAPQPGTVLSLNVQPGSVVGARSTRPLAVLLPDRPLIVRAEVNESFVGRLRPGMRAEVTVPSDPRAAPIPGRLARIGQAFAASRLDDDAALRANVRVVESVVVFTGPLALRIGQHVQVTFHD
jgi:multidrug resistance efflux pump